MKTTAIALVFFMIAPAAWGHCGKEFHLSEQEQKNLIAKADAGDADAAFRMYNYHSMSSGEEDLASKWLDRAAELGHTESQRWLAHMIAENGSPHRKFGITRKRAVLKLLSTASKTDGFAANDLGELYYEGYFGEADKFTKAREAFILAASLHSSWCWETLARMLHLGEGGEANQTEAYYYVCLRALCIHPESVSGKENLELRRSIEAKLTLEQAKEVWARVDSYISKERKREGGRIYPPPLLGTGIPEEEWNEACKTTNEFEARHRKEIEETNANKGADSTGLQPVSRP